MEEIEEIQEEHDREQFYHDQEQEMRIQEKEEEHERTREHNMALMHQVTVGSNEHKRCLKELMSIAEYSLISLIVGQQRVRISC